MTKSRNTARSDQGSGRRDELQVHSPSLVDDIAFRLQSDIMAGVFPPGAHLQQDELCQKYGVSRTPVREALHKLHAQNLVTIVPNKGATVRIPTERDLREVYAMRGELEGFSAELAAGNWSDADDMDLLAAQAKLTAFVARGLAMREPSPEEEASMGARIARANEEFHSIIHQASGNTRLRNLILDLENSLPVSQIWRALRDANETEELNVRDHEDIAVALRDGDGPAAREAMSRHITRAGELLVEHLREVGFWKGKALR